MKNKFIWLSLSLLLVAVMLLASCATSTTTSTSKPTLAISTTKTTSTTTKTTNTTSPTTTAVTTTTTVAGNWWDSLGKPQYGGTITIRINKNIASFDTYNAVADTDVTSAWMEPLHADNWTLNPAIFNYTINFHPNEYVKGDLGESWEFPGPSTYVLHLRKGIHWQDIPPASGREFVASDVVFHFDRLYGLGSGMTPSPLHAGDSNITDLISVVAADTYTIVFKFKTLNPEFMMETLQAAGSEQWIENPEAVKQWGDLNDWHHAIGTGPFILKDFVSGSSATMVKNPNYWGYDERYPQNQLPYVDKLDVLVIPDDATAFAGLRTGKIDAMDGISLQNAQSMKKTNPEILQLTVPRTAAVTVDPRNDVTPFNDIRVREAMQMAIDLPTIANSYYGGTVPPYPCSLTSYYMTGWGFPYDQWPQDLKDQYAFNPTAAKKLLADAGYTNGFKTDIVVDFSGDMDLVQVIKSYFANIGITMEIRPMDSASWSAFVQVGRKQDQLAQKSSGTLGLTYEPTRQLSRIKTGIVSDYLMVSDPVFDAFAPKAMAAGSVDEIKQIVKDANEYVARQHFAISLLQPNLFALYQPWFKGYSGQTNSISGTGGGPLMLGFYASRFWIDQGLKKSMGH